MKDTRNWVSLAAALLALAVIFGAFGAHALANRLDQYQLSVYEKASFYHFVHALALLVVSLFPALGLLNQKVTNRICMIFALGIVFFSGSLYLLAIIGSRWLGAITPIGGTLFIVAWGALVVCVRKGAL